MATRLAHSARGADPVLDQRAKKSYQERLAGLAEDIEDAEAAGRAGRAEVPLCEGSNIGHVRHAPLLQRHPAEAGPRSSSGRAS